MKNKIEKVDSLCNDLINWIKKERATILKLNSSCSQDTEYWMSKDFEFVNLFLSSYYENTSQFFNRQLKPKGKIIIILSFNEPLIMSIVPILNALVAGNQLTVRPSRRGREFFNYIWKKSGIIHKYNLNLKILADDELPEDELNEMQALYFFGGYKNAKKVSLLCSKHFIEFYPEIEAADFKIVKFDHPNNFNIDRDVNISLEEAFSHSGQACQRVQGVFVPEKDYEKYSKRMAINFNKLCSSREMANYISHNLIIDGNVIKSANLDISKSSPENIIRGNNRLGLPILVLSPEPTSIFVRSAYFLPIIWVAKYLTEKRLFDYINSRQYHLGMNIQSDDNTFIHELVSRTNFTRYTINTDHSRVRPEEGWGGTWPSGYSGYKSWIELFSYPYQIITE